MAAPTVPRPLSPRLGVMGNSFWCLDPEKPDWSGGLAMLHGSGGSSIPQDLRTSGEGTLGRLGLGSPSTFLPVSVAPRSSATTEQAGQWLWGNVFFLQYSGA